MLFRKDIEPRCAYCQRGRPLGERVICARKGVMDPAGYCRGFVYDPLKRVPPKPARVDFIQWKDEDFLL